MAAKVKFKTSSYHDVEKFVFHEAFSANKLTKVKANTRGDDSV
jgi:hypothetical protein